MPPARPLGSACKKPGYFTARKMRTVCIKLGGRKGQGKGRVTGRAGIGKGKNGACKWGVSRRTGHCRTKARLMMLKRTKKNKKYIERKGLVVPLNTMINRPDSNSGRVYMNGKRVSL
jgi:hypothetical protein